MLLESRPRLLLQRTGALGDVFEATAILSRLRTQNPDAIINVRTACGDVFRGNPDLDAQAPDSYDKVFDLDMAFENTLRKLHPIDAYSQVVFQDTLTYHELKFRWEPMKGIPPKSVVLHAARSWPIRTLSREFWQILVDKLKSAGFYVYLTGTHQDWDGLVGVRDMRSRLTLAQQVGLIEACSCFVCSESGPMIFSQVTRTPIIPLLTMVPPEHIEHLRYGERAWRFYPIRASVPCVGCAAEQESPVTYFDCKLGTRACVSSFDPQIVFETVLEYHIERPEL